MRRSISMAVLFVAITILVEPAHAASWLKGRVYENHGSTKKPAIGAQVWIVHVGNPDTTLSDGAYQVLVPDAIRFGQTIELFVKRKGWAIATPVGGKVELSKELTTDILLSPEASSEFLSPAQLAKLLESLSEKLRGQVKTGGDPGDTDPVQVVKDYAMEHHLSEPETVSKVEALIIEYEQSDNLGKRCLAAKYRKNLNQLAIVCRAAVARKTEELKKQRQEVENLSKSLQRSENPRDRSTILLLVGNITMPATGWQDRVTNDVPWTQFVADSHTPAQLEEAKRQLIKLTEEVVGEFNLNPA